MDIDLNIENYNLEELLNLFKLPINFTEQQLRDAKKYVFKVHPDKSNLPKEYFIFFAKAYKYIYYISEFKKKTTNKHSEYKHVINDKEYDISTIVNKATKKENFNTWFNKMFEEYSLKEKDNGYEDWLKNEDYNIKNENEIKNLFDNTTHLQKSNSNILVHKEINDTYNNISCGSSTINKKNINDYSCNNIFSQGLNYNDVKKAHTESLIQVTIDDYNNKKKYNNELELKFERGKKINIPSKEESNRYIQEKRIQEEVIASKDAYDLLRKQDEQENLNKLFMKNLRLLK